MTGLRSLAAVLIAVTLAAGCSRSQGAPAPGGPRRAAGVTVRVEPVAVKDVVYAINAVGSLEAEEVVQVTAEVEGAVAAVLFNEGARVSPRTVLARIDPDRYRLEAARAEAAFRRAEADARRAESDYQRREQLAGERLVAVEELTRARAERDRLVADTAAMRAAWNIAQQNAGRADVKAPAGGVINTRKVEKGQWVKQGDVLATIVDISRLRLRFKVSEGESLRAVKDQEVAFRVNALGNARFGGTIYHVGEVADPATRQVEVLAWVRNPGVLKPGFFAEVELASETHAAATVVPERAVQASEQGFVTYVVEGGTARSRRVEIGVRTGDGLVEILGGLKQGETVVVEGNDRVADGVAVSVAGAGPAAASGPRGGGAAAGAAQ
jgi:membrane fusion protein, multidrug efflux system